MPRSLASRPTSLVRIELHPKYELDTVFRITGKGYWKIFEKRLAQERDIAIPEGAGYLLHQRTTGEMRSNEYWMRVHFVNMPVAHP